MQVSQFSSGYLPNFTFLYRIHSWTKGAVKILQKRIQNWLLGVYAVIVIIGNNHQHLLLYNARYLVSDVFLLLNLFIHIFYLSKFLAIRERSLNPEHSRRVNSSLDSLLQGFVPVFWTPSVTSTDPEHLFKKIILSNKSFSRLLWYQNQSKIYAEIKEHSHWMGRIFGYTHFQYYIS